MAGKSGPSGTTHTPATAIVKAWTYYPDAADRRDAVPIEVRPGQTYDDLVITIRQWPRVRVTGRVEPLPSQYVQDDLTVDLHPIGGQPGQDTTVLPSGPARSFEFREVPAGDYLLIVKGSHFETNPASGVRAGRRRLIAKLNVLVGRNDIDDLRIPVPESISVVGRLNIEGQPAQILKGLEITLQPVPLDGDLLGSPKRAAVYEDGTFLVTDCDPIEYTVHLNGHGDTYVKSIAFNSQDIISTGLKLGLVTTGKIEIILAAGGGEIQGTVKAEAAEDKAGPQAQVVLLPADFNEESSLEVPAAQPDKNGVFAIRNIRPGTYYAVAAQSSSHNWEGQVVRDQIKALGQHVVLDNFGRLQLELKPVRLGSS